MLSKFELELIEYIEGYSAKKYLDTEGYTTIGIGFNMDSSSARDIWTEIVDSTIDFNSCYDGSEELPKEYAYKLLDYIWKEAEVVAKSRAEHLGYNWDMYTEYHKFVLTDIVYNTGSCRHWTKVFKYMSDKEVMIESRRKQRELDSRVSKIAYRFKVIRSLQEAIDLGLSEAKYV